MADQEQRLQNDVQGCMRHWAVARGAAVFGRYVALESAHEPGPSQTRPDRKDKDGVEPGEFLHLCPTYQTRDAIAWNEHRKHATKNQNPSDERDDEWEESGCGNIVSGCAGRVCARSRFGCRTCARPLSARRRIASRLPSRPAPMRGTIRHSSTRLRIGAMNEARRHLDRRPRQGGFGQAPPSRYRPGR
jgi:hypothetical protein